jgi:uncharacterized membrane protein
LLDLSWDDIPTTMEENGTHNFTIFAKNVGSENGTFDISLSAPADWIWDANVTNVSLNMSHVTSFEVRVNASERVLAAPQTITVMAIPREGDTEASELDITVNIEQHYGFEMRANLQMSGDYSSELGGDGNFYRNVSYTFTVENTGNGKERIQLTYGDISGWSIKFPISELPLEGYEEQGAVIIEASLPDREEMKPQTLRITGRSLNSPDLPTQTLDLELTYPDLTAKKENVAGDDDGEPLEWPEDEAPGFPALIAIVTVGLAALVSYRRRRGW